jgi:hypothetical protein
MAVPAVYRPWPALTPQGCAGIAMGRATAEHGLSFESAETLLLKTLGKLLFDGPPILTSA